MSIDSIVLDERISRLRSQSIVAIVRSAMNELCHVDSFVIVDPISYFERNNVHSLLLKSLSWRLRQSLDFHSYHHQIIQC
jgi:hypothetical protein